VSLLTPPARQIDPRGQRFGAGISAVVLAIAFAVSAPWLAVLVGVNLGVSAAFGTRLFLPGRAWRPVKTALRLGPPKEFEHEYPPRFAQALGATVLGLAAIAFLVGAGPIGLAAVLTAKLFTPGRIVAIDPAQPRLEKALELGADVAIDNSHEDAVERVMQLTDGLGADVAIEAVGIPETFELCTDIVRPGGHVANVGVHGHPATLHLERLWIRDVTITTGLVDTNTTPRLLKLIAEGRLDATPFATHRFPLGETMAAYDVFGDAASTNALKVVLEATPVAEEQPAREEALVGNSV